MVHPTQQRRPRPSNLPLTSLTIATGSKVRTLRMRGWILALLVSAAGVLIPGYIAATAYLIYRDDLLGASLSRQVAIQYAYEDRIAALRTELDRLTSRQVVASQGVGDQVGLLLERQAHIDRRQNILNSLLASASQHGVAVPIADAGLPRTKAGVKAPVRSQKDGPALGYLESEHQDDPITGSLIDEAPPRLDPEALKPILEDIQSSLEAIQKDQGRALDLIMDQSRAELERLTAALSNVGAATNGAAVSGTGGPFVPPETMHFVEKSAMLDDLLKQLSGIRRFAAALPLRKPVAGQISSLFGNRVDPFLGKPALHAGIDFVAAEGTPVRATAPGTVVTADWNGGYGQMVEIRHVDGVTTRYAHLSQIQVAAGQKVKAGMRIGLVGSTGRSTGPHLHYETRRSGTPVNPALYLTAARAF